MRLALIRAACLACVLAPPVGAETRQHGNMIFDIPPGWTFGTVRDDGSLTLYSDLPDEECRFCYIYVAPGLVGRMAPDRWLTAQARRFVDTDGSDPAVVEVAQAAQTMGVQGHDAAMLAQRVNGDVQVLFTVQLPGRMEMIGFQANGPDEAELAEGLAVLQRDIVPMIEGARYVSEGAAPLMPAPQPGEMSGTYWGTHNWWTVGLDGMMQMRIDHRWLTFWPDGLFYDGTPPEGLAGFDQDARLAKGDMDWGSYRVDDKVLTLNFASGEVEMVEREAQMLQTDLSVLNPVEPLPDGTPGQCVQTPRRSVAKFSP